MDMTATQDRSVRLFKFLQEFTQLKFKPQRTSDAMELLWLHSLPQEKEIQNVVRLSGRDTAPEEWLAIRKPRFHAAPTLPEPLQPWVIRPLDDAGKAPTVRDQLVITSEIMDEDLRKRTIKETLFLDEQPEIAALWQTYRETWGTWAAEELRARSVQEHYSRLFDFHQKLSTLGETFELRLGLGYLVWQTPGGEEVRRHLLTARAALEFDPLKGILSVSAAGDGARTTLEQDMLEPGERPLPQVEQSIQQALLEDGEDLWSGATLPPLLQTWVHAAGERGEFTDVLLPPRGAKAHPVVSWSPALILRRRGERSLTAAYGEILNQVSAAGSTPETLRAFVQKGGGATARPASSASLKNVYFPLPANDAQLEIIRRLERQEGVLVQGPPGTGKSHTIVNLVSHLLATDQRVLVTSHTARALKVLREKFPPELAGLSVTHLRGEEGARAMLEGSVSLLLERSTNRQPWQEEQQLTLLSSTLEQARQQETRLLDDLRQIREAETNALNLFGYQGSAQHIGERIRIQEAQYGWISDLVIPKGPAPLTDAQAVRLLTLLRDFSAEEVTALEQRWPGTETLTSPEDFIRFVQAESQAHENAQTQQAARNHPVYPQLLTADPTRRRALITALQRLQAAVLTERRKPVSWLPAALDALLKDQRNLWAEVQARTAELLPEVQARADWLEQTPLSGTEGRDPATLRSDAQAVLEHLKAGGHWGKLFSKPAAVRERQYLRETVRVAGQPAATPAVLQELLDHLRLTSQLIRLEEVWAAAEVKAGGSVKLRVTALAEQGRMLTALNALAPILQAAREATSHLPGLPEPRWWISEEVDSLITAAQAAQAEGEAHTRRQVLEALTPALDALAAAPQAHPVVGELRSALQHRDAQGYGQAYTRVQQLSSRRALWQDGQTLLAQLRGDAPALADEVQAAPQDPLWAERLGQLEAAWRWRQADVELERLANPDTEVEVREELATCRQQIRDTLGQLAAAYAWQNTLNRMTGVEQQALVRWQKAMKSLGKGLGKNAERHRRVAREALEDARSAIPAWIMPLHLVAETFQMSPGMFDVVIVDEASQAGPEALFLTYLAKKIIVVGDDKQIEPEGVGIQTERVDALVHQYLQGFPAPEILGERKASLFGFGMYSYAPMISLREHFRCMPEIIKFSSDLSYPDHPLMALRQFGAQRLQPLIAHLVSGGHTVERRGDKVNPVEARALVEQVKACIANPRYAGKTFGVISLVGEAQAEQISSLLRAEVPEDELDRRRLVCGNAYSFQGDERDVMFLSMVESPTEGKLSRKVSRDDGTFQPRYNVAVSRARDQLWLFHSVDLSDLNSDDLRASLIRHVRSPGLEYVQPLASQRILDLREQAARPGRRPGTQPAPFDSWFEVDVYLDIVARGYRVVPQYPLNGYRIDLVVEGLRGRLAVECDGDQWHGADRYQDDLHRQQTLERAGMQFWRVRGSTYARDPEAALEDLWRTLDARGVYPEGDPRNLEPVPTGADDLAPAATEEATLAEEAGQEPIDETASEVVPADASPSPVTLPPYTHWAAQTLPDPRTLDTFDAVIAGLRDIIAAEGPMTCRQAYQTYTRAAGIHYGKSVQSLLNKAMTRALRAQLFEQTDEWGTVGQVDKVVRSYGTTEVSPRQRGPRELTDIPPLEVAALMRQFGVLEPALLDGDPEPLFRRVLVIYGAQRLTARARLVLERAYALLEQTVERPAEQAVLAQPEGV